MREGGRDKGEREGREGEGEGGNEREKVKEGVSGRRGGDEGGRWEKHGGLKFIFPDPLPYGNREVVRPDPTCLWTLVRCSRFFSRKQMRCFWATLPSPSSHSSSALWTRQETTSTLPFIEQEFINNLILVK